MNRQNLNSLLDNVYELEGLLHLAIAREDCPEIIPTLIANKATEVAERARLEAGMQEATVNDAKPAETPAPTEPEPPVQPATQQPRGRLVFTINDRFRFKRDLFGGSDADFNNSLALVASMDNYEEAEDYFINEIQLDPQAQETIDFLEIIKRYFK